MVVIEKKSFTYILTNKTGSVLYVGVTNNLLRRMHEHKNKLIEGFTKKYNLTSLVYYEVHDHIEDAIYREKMIKKKSKKGKIRLIETLNKNWEDLSNRL